MLTAIIVDDEPLARNLLTAILDEIIGVNIVAECKNGFEAIEAVIEYTPDVMFLDIEMPALNYVLKPLDDEKIRESVERVKMSLKAEGRPAAKVEILTALKSTENLMQDQSLIVRDNDKIAFLDKNEIDWIEADGDYVCIHKGLKTHLIRTTLKSVELELLKTNFQRIHRSTIVNLNKVSEIISAQKGEAIVIMKTGQRLKVSRSYGAALRAKLI